MKRRSDVPVPLRLMSLQGLAPSLPLVTVGSLWGDDKRIDTGTAGQHALCQVADGQPGACFPFFLHPGVSSFISTRVRYLETLKFSSPLDWALQRFKKLLPESENHVTP